MKGTPRAASGFQPEGRSSPLSWPLPSRLGTDPFLETVSAFHCGQSERVKDLPRDLPLVDFSLASIQVAMLPNETLGNATCDAKCIPVAGSNGASPEHSVAVRVRSIALRCLGFVDDIIQVDEVAATAKHGPEIACLASVKSPSVVVSAESGVALATAG